VALVFSILTGELMKLNNLSDAEAMSAANIYYVSVCGSWVTKCASCFSNSKHSGSRSLQRP
jgi:hypothetical protein